jgi:hypothetical protein
VIRISRLDFATDNSFSSTRKAKVAGLDFVIPKQKLIMST